MWVLFLGYTRGILVAMLSPGFFINLSWVLSLITPHLLVAARCPVWLSHSSQNLLPSMVLITSHALGYPRTIFRTPGLSLGPCLEVGLVAQMLCVL